MSDFRDGVLISEVFESVFDQIAPLFDQYEVSEEDRSVIKEKVKEQVAIVAKSYGIENKIELYEALKNLRVVATDFQFKCFKMMKPKPETEARRIIMGRRRL
jgi:hypothetical protein